MKHNIAVIDAEGDVSFFVAHDLETLNWEIAEWCKEHWTEELGQREEFDHDWQNDEAIMHYFAGNENATLYRGTAHPFGEIPF